MLSSAISSARTSTTDIRSDQGTLREASERRTNSGHIPRSFAVWIDIAFLDRLRTYTSTDQLINEPRKLFTNKFGLRLT